MGNRKISLDSKHIREAIKDLKEIEKEIDDLPKDIEKILDEAVIYCMKNTPISDKDGRHLRFNTYWEKTSDGYRIVQEGENVTYVEFGTGVVGENSPHPEASDFGWKYGIGEHIFTTKDGRRGWFFPLESGGEVQVRFTEGQKANMQMYKTARWLEERLDREIKMKMKRVDKKWSQY